jgi:hypothetical protein
MASLMDMCVATKSATRLKSPVKRLARFSTGKIIDQCFQNAQAIKPPIVTKTVGKNHLSNSRWNVQGRFFTGGIVFEGLFFIAVARLSAELPLEMFGRIFETTPPHFYSTPDSGQQLNQVSKFFEFFNLQYVR